MGNKKKARARNRQVTKALKKSSEPLQQGDSSNSSREAMKLIGQATTLVVNDDRVKSLLEFRSRTTTDNLDQLLEYMQINQTLDCKTLSQHMPQLCSDIQEGKITAPVAAQNIIQAFMHHQDPNAVAVDFNHMASRLADRMLGFVPNYKELLDVGDFERLQATILYYWFDEDGDGPPGKHGRGGETPNLLVQIKCVIEKSCKHMAELFDKKLCGGVVGEFIRQCPLLGLTLKELHDVWNNLTNDKPDEALNNLSADVITSTMGVEKGVLEARSRCWECGVIPNCEVLICGNCEFASYCSKSCQMKAWKEGHKTCCSLLADKKAKLEDEIQTIDEEHDAVSTSFSSCCCSSGGIIILSDYFCLLSKQANEPIFNGYPGLGDPSMKHFYKNFYRVSQDKFWIIAETPTVDTYMNKFRRSLGGEAEDIEQRVFLYILSLLCYDLDSLVEEEGNNMSISSIYTYVATKLGLPNSDMPAERFLELYRDIRPVGVPTDYEKDWKRNKRFLVKAAEKFLRFTYEKKTK